MVKLVRIGFDFDVAPQAIFWRPLIYFTPFIRRDRDDLDSFDVASFCIGNEITFDLRKYRRHPDFTVTLYLPREIESTDTIVQIVKIVVAKMAIPKSAIAWHRGLAFEFGRLTRPIGDRLREPEARVLALKIASLRPARAASTEFIKQEVPKYTQLSPSDLVRSKTRRKERLWQQIVGNVVSHKDTSASPFSKGYAVRTQNGLRVTPKGLLYLNNLGFSVEPE